MAIPGIPTMGTASASRPTRATSTTKVVKVPGLSRRTTPKVRAPKIKVVKPKMPKDATALMVPKAKKIKNGKAHEFSTKRKPVI